MAKATIRFRFVFNRDGARSGSAAKNARAAVNAVIEDVALKYASGTFNQVKTIVQSQVVRDVGSELSWMAGLMKRHIIGISGQRTAPNGYASMAHEMAAVSRGLGIRPSHSASEGIKWPNRRHRYMSWKQHNFGHRKWFLNKGATLGRALGNKGTWTGAYGPIQVRVIKGDTGGLRSSLTPGNITSRGRYQTRAGRVRYHDADVSTFRTTIARVEVAALGKITPAQLPALASGEMGSYNPDGRASGLLTPLGSDVAYRLGGAQGRVPYRHTIEPFLSFFLTRAVPNALFLRLERGLGTSLDPLRRSR